MKKITNVFECFNGNNVNNYIKNNNVSIENIIRNLIKYDDISSNGGYNSDYDAVLCQIDILIKAKINKEIIEEVAEDFNNEDYPKTILINY
jgi:Mor family transcriptional regulator